MSRDTLPSESDHVSAFEKIRRINEAGNEYWSSRDLAGVLGYGQYRNFEPVIEKAKTACFNSGQRIDDHFADMRKMIEIGKGGMRAVPEIYLSRYVCYLIVQNADPSKPVVATGQTYFAVQTRRQELAANAFRATQAESNIRREGITGKDHANKAHKEVGVKVRHTIKELGGTMPEHLPIPKTSAKQLEAKRKNLEGIKAVGKRGKKK